ncbi:hypothetical protein [Streptomyces rubiginosohelvolus]|uniref:hypothetical protein n=1 Tax=Streptomyces rubiginosohelvolus TaxID=67362 RepID=UPI0033B149E7
MPAHARSSEKEEAEQRSPQGRSAGFVGTEPVAGPHHHLPRAAGNTAVARAIARERQEAHGESGHTAAHTAGANQGSGAVHIQRTADEELREAKTPEQIVAALKKSGHSEDDAWELMQYMTSQQAPAGEGQADFDMLGSIKDASEALQKVKAVRRKMAAPLMAKRWTIRHYTGSDPNTPPSFQQIASTYDNAAAGRASEHTNVADWRSLGNIKCDQRIRCRQRPGFRAGHGHRRRVRAQGPRRSAGRRVAQEVGRARRTGPGP